MEDAASKAIVAASLKLLRATCLPIEEDDLSLIQRAKSGIDALYRHGFRQLYAVGRGERGEEYQGVQLNRAVRECSACSEPFVIERVLEAGGTLKTIAVAHKNRATGEVHLVRPCQRCAIILREDAPSAAVLMEYEGQLWKVPVQVLLPLVSARDLTIPPALRRAAKQYVMAVKQKVSAADRRLIQEAREVAGQSELRVKSDRIVIGKPVSGRSHIGRETKKGRVSAMDIMLEKAAQDVAEIVTITVLEGGKVVDPEPLRYEAISHDAPNAVVIVWWKGKLAGIPIRGINPFRYKHLTAQDDPAAERYRF